MAQSVTIDFIAKTGGAIRDINKLNRAVGAQATKWDKTRAGIKRMLPVALAGGAALAVAGKKAVNSASDQSEAVSKAQTIWGKYYDTIEKGGANAAKTMGLSKTAYLEGTAAIAGLGQGAGLTNKELAKLAPQIQQRAADLASFNNLGVTETQEAYNAALRGEYEPLRRANIQLSKKRIEERAMKMGLYDGNGALSERARFLATEAEIAEQAGVANGDYIRTQDSMANKMRTVSVQIEDLSAALGSALLPIVEKVIGVFSKLVGWLQENQGVAKALIGVIGGFVAAVLAANIALGIHGAILKINSAYMLLFATQTQVATGAATRQGVVIRALTAIKAAAVVMQQKLNAAMKANPILFVIGLLIAIGAALVVAYKKSETFRNFVDALWGTIKTVFSAIKDAAVAVYENGIKPLWDGAKTAFKAIGTIIKALYTAVIKPWWDQVKAIFDLVISLLKGDFKGAWDAAKRVVSTAIGNIKTYILKIPSFLLEVVSKVPSAALAIGTAILNGIKNGLKGLAEWIWQQIKGIPGRLKSAVGSALSSLNPFGKTVPDGYKNPLAPGSRSLQPMGRSTVNVNVVSGGDERILVSEEQIARAVYRVLARSDARNGLEFA